MKKRVALFFRPDNTRACMWAKKLSAHIASKHPGVIITNERPHVVFALGGDGTILEAARTYRKNSPTIVGFNLGNVGFLASVRRPKDFIKTADAFFKGAYTPHKRMMVHAGVHRRGKLVHEVDSLNEVAVQGLLGTIRLAVSIENHPLQYIHGNGVLVATPTGSTAYNLSAHGPIITPDIECLVVTELLDHNIPTPSIIVKHTKTIRIHLTESRQRDLLSVRATGETVNAVLASDDAGLFPLLEGDQIDVTSARRGVTFAEFETGYFIKSLHEKFAFH